MRVFASLPVPLSAYLAAVARRAARGESGPGSPFGIRPDPFGSAPPKLHAGQDVAVPEGTLLLAVDDGEVVEVRDTESAGLVVRYRTADGLVSCMHLQSASVFVGGRVLAGEVIGHTGASGRVTGAHLHLEFRPAGASGNVDPLPLFPAATTAASSSVPLIVAALVVWRLFFGGRRGR